MENKEVEFVKILLYLGVIVVFTYYFFLRVDEDVSEVVPPETPAVEDQTVVKQDKMSTKIFLGEQVVNSGGLSFTLELKDLGKYIARQRPWLGPSLYNPEIAMQTKGKFMHARVNINNTGSETAFFSLLPNNIIDQEGRLYGYLGVASSDCSYQNLVSYSSSDTKSIEPNIPCEINYLFEVSDDSQSFTLELLHVFDPIYRIDSQE